MLDVIYVTFIYLCVKVAAFQLGFVDHPKHKGYKPLDAYEKEVEIP